MSVYSFLLHLPVCIYAWSGQRLTSVFLFHSSPWFLKQSLSLNLELTDLLRSDSQWSSGLCLFFSTPLLSTGMIDTCFRNQLLCCIWGSDLWSSCLCNEYFAYRPFPQPQSLFILKNKAKYPGMFFFQVAIYYLKYFLNIVGGLEITQTMQHFMHFFSNDFAVTRKGIHKRLLALKKSIFTLTITIIAR